MRLVFSFLKLLLQLPARAMTGYSCKVMLNLDAKAAIRLVGGPADGYVLSVPVSKIPPFVCVGQTTSYERELGDSDAIGKGGKQGCD